MNHRITLVLAATAALAAGGLATAGSASASPTTNCAVAPYGPNCIFYSQNYDGSHTGVPENLSNFPVSGSTAYRYLSSGSGQGQYLGNNNGSLSNRDNVCAVTAWYSTNSRGPFLTLTRYGVGVYQARGAQQGQLLNNIRSQSWGC